MKLKILTEASGSLVSAYMLKAIKEAGYSPIASDTDMQCVGRYLADDFVQMPSKNDAALWEKIIQLLQENQINVVIPSFDETLLGWALRKAQFSQLGIHVLLSDIETIEICQDKWLTYQAFVKYNIPTPQTSLQQDFALVKPRNGRGAVGVQLTEQIINMQGMISQEYLTGEEYTIDVFCDNNHYPVYIVPRKRIGVKDGKSTGGVTVYNSDLIKWVKIICEKIAFKGAINIQCFINERNEIKFTEINPRIAGGMALAFAATENWVALMVEHFINKQNIIPKPIQYDLKMKRYYAEVFYQ